MSVIQYLEPDHWIKYAYEDVKDALLTAKAHLLTLKAIPFQRRWIKELQDIQLKLEVGGSSKIEGADFAANELDVAIKAESTEELITRSQKQAHSLSQTYKWIATLPDGLPLSVELIKEMHRRIVTDCDEDHCPPGQLRTGDHQVTFGLPRHRGAMAGKECADLLERLTAEWATTYSSHDPLIRALALHYHFAAMHPFADGNGRTARAMEALALQRTGLKDSLFIAMSNYYYDEKHSYLKSLAEVRARNHDLTPFLLFGLRGIALQIERLSALIKKAVSKEIFRNLMHELFVHLESTRKRVIVRRQLQLLERLLDVDGEIDFFQDWVPMVSRYYVKRRNPTMAIVRDVNRLSGLGAVLVRKVEAEDKGARYMIKVNLDWPTTITETEFFARLASMPRSKTHGFLISDHVV
jgi:Fic family protein